MKWSAILRNKRSLRRHLAAGHVRLPRLDPPGAGREQALRPVRGRDPDRPGATPRPTRRSSGIRQVKHARRAGRRHRPALPRPAAPVRPVPPPPVRDVEPGRLLRLRRLLRPGRPQAGPDPVTPADLRPARGPGDRPADRQDRTPTAARRPRAAPTSARAHDPRQALADWLRQPDNPFFARALVNRYWKHFFGRGLVEPEDDMRATNPPTQPRAARRPGRRLRRATATT